MGVKKKNELSPWMVSLYSHCSLFPLFPSFVFIYSFVTPWLGLLSMLMQNSLGVLEQPEKRQG